MDKKLRIVKIPRPNNKQKLEAGNLTPHYYFARPDNVEDKRRITVCLLTRLYNDDIHFMARGVTMCSLQEPSGFLKGTGKAKALGRAISAYQRAENVHGCLPKNVISNGLPVGEAVAISKATYLPLLTERELAIMASYKRYLEKKAKQNNESE